MKNLAYKVLVDIWRLTYKYRFQKLDESHWEKFIADGEALMVRYKGTDAESLFRYFFQAVQAFYENL